MQFDNTPPNLIFDKMKLRVSQIPSNCDKPIPGFNFKCNNNRFIVSNSERELIKAKDLLNKSSKNKWNFFRDLVNPYEFNNIDKIGYINRAYFKLHEIIKVFGIEQQFKDTKINYSGVCEFPCGFAKCVLDNDVLSKSVEHANIISNDDNKPKIGYADKISIDVIDITDKESLKSVLVGKAHKSMLVTSDGGINEGEEYSKKEELHFKLKLYEIGTALRLLNVGGTIVIKFFDFFTTPTVEMIYYLSFFFKELYVYKPLTSRPTNSERYVVGKYMVKRESNLALNIPSNIENLSSFLDTHIPQEFFNIIRRINNNIVNTQINNIKFVVDKMNADVDDREKIYFTNKKNKEQKKFFDELCVKKL